MSIGLYNFYKASSNTVPKNKPNLNSPHSKKILWWVYRKKDVDLGEVNLP